MSSNMGGTTNTAADETPQAMSDIQDDKPTSPSWALQAIRKLNKELGEKIAQMDCMFPGLPEAPGLDIRGMSTDEIIERGNQNIRQLTAAAHSIPVLRAMDRQERRLSSDEQSNTAMAAALAKAFGRA